MFISVLLVFAFLVSVVASSYPNVKVELFYEALCPGCQQFITTTLSYTLAKADIKAITDLHLVPYGNTKKNADGTFTCQHGPDECTSDAYELCTLYKLSGNLTSIDTGDTAYGAWPFIQCLESNDGNPATAKSCFQTTMSGASITWDDVYTCSTKEYDAVQNEAKNATPAHDYVPWVLVNGQLLENNQLLLQAICKAYTGPKPASCSRAVEKSIDLCYNK